jgi:hypothetical protein
MRVHLIGSMFVIACGGGGGDAPSDASSEAPDIGFKRPTAALRAHMAAAGGAVDLGPANLTCLNAASADLATTVAVAVTTEVRDFQSEDLVPNVQVTAFANQELDQPFATVAADAQGALQLDVPVGIRRFGYKMVDPTSLDTLLLNQRVDPNNPAQTVPAIRSVSKATAQTLPALIGIARTAGTGVLAGAIRDCADHDLSNFIATVAINQATAPEDIVHAPGADSYYFSAQVGLPVRHTQEAMGTENGLFMIVELEPAATAFVQVWGYLDDAALQADRLTKIAELKSPVIADTVITGSFEPLRTE